MHQELIKLRHELHAHPELSSREHQTAGRIAARLKKCQPDTLLEGIGGTGVIAVYNGQEAGPTLVLRCELDALPIPEPDELQIGYGSESPGVSHKCGHDGHMATLCGVAEHLGLNRPRQGKVCLLFQPAEETGEGAPSVISDPRFRALEPDYVFGFHNLPKQPLHSICIRKGVFASASVGLRVEISGETSHSSYPEDGKSPVPAMIALLQQLPEAPVTIDAGSGLVRLTLTHGRIGERELNFGIAPGIAEVACILRAHEQDDLENLKDASVKLINEVCSEFEVALSWHEEFPSTRNHEESVAVLENAIETAGLSAKTLDVPQLWSEDFGHYLMHYNGAFFGLGSGLDQPQLHHQDYDFPDEIIESGIKIWLGLIDEILN